MKQCRYACDSDRIAISCFIADKYLFKACRVVAESTNMRAKHMAPKIDLLPLKMNVFAAQHRRSALGGDATAHTK
jgi:hypothetical protein